MSPDMLATVVPAVPTVVAECPRRGGSSPRCGAWVGGGGGGGGSWWGLREGRGGGVGGVVRSAGARRQTKRRRGWYKG